MPIAVSAANHQQQRAISASRSQAAPTKSDKPLYAQQHSLPHLPVPSLNSTFHKYLETIQPHVSTQSFDHNKTLVNKFLDSPLSSVLQARLEARASEKESWLSEWWNEAAYMGYRDSIVPNVNYYYLHKEGLAKGSNQTRRAAEIVRGVGQFRELLVR
jgi:carnitine O-acetyltransferase